MAVPVTTASAGDHTVRRFLEFYAAFIRNKNTRQAYRRTCTKQFVLRPICIGVQNGRIQ